MKKRLSTQELIEAADSVASDLLVFARNHEISAHDLLMVTALAERLLQNALCGENPQAALHAVLEADATFTAVSEELEAN